VTADVVIAVVVAINTPARNDWIFYIAGRSVSLLHGLVQRITALTAARVVSC